MPREAKYGNFGEAVRSSLTASGTSQSALASDVGISVQYLNQMMTAKRPASAHWADLVAQALRLQEQQRAALHRAAALDNGFALDLTPGL